MQGQRFVDRHLGVVLADGRVIGVDERRPAVADRRRAGGDRVGVPDDGEGVLLTERAGRWGGVDVDDLASPGAVE